MVGFEDKPSDVIFEKINDIWGVWEEGGFFNRWGYSCIVTDPSGNKKQPYLILNETNRKHAFIPTQKNDWVIRVHKYSDEKCLEIYVIQINNDTTDIKTTPLQRFCVLPQKIYHHYKNGKWYKGKPPHFLEDAIDCAINKALTPGCKEPFYIDITNQKNTA